MTDSLDFLLDLLDLERIEVDVFRGRAAMEARQRAFGGQIAAQALMAAGRTVEHGRVHSLHSYFLRPGDAMSPTLYEVDRIRDGKSFATRRVVAIQHGRAIYNLQASFHADEEGFDHQVAMPAVPAPETLEPLPQRIARELGDDHEWFNRPHPIDQRFLGPIPYSANPASAPGQRLWFRADGDLPDDPLLHACVVTYASDLNLMGAIVAVHPVRWDDGSFMGASLDHCMWFHRDLRADDWLFCDMDSPVAHAGRGLARGFLFGRDGELKVTMVQEGLLRRLTPTYASPDAAP